MEAAEDARPLRAPSAARKRVSFEEVNVGRIRTMLQEDERLAVRPEEHKRRRKMPHFLAQALSGMMGSIAAELILFPADTIKLLIQTSSGSNGGIVATLVGVLRERGLGGLYKGLGANLLKESVHSLNFWLWHGLLFRQFAVAADTTQTPATTRLLLNLLAKQLNWLCTVPFEVVSSVNQLSPKSLGFFSTAAALYRRGGLREFYRGLAISLTLAINPAIMNTLITSLLRFTAALHMLRGLDHRAARDHGPATIFVATGFAKFLATVGTYPLIRAKVLQQTAPEELGVLAILRSILRTEGAKGLYRGLLAMSYKTVCWNALMMAFKHLLGPARAVTPPTTPPQLDPASLIPPVPWMGRTPFPNELITVEKLDEILGFLKRDNRVHKLENRMNQMSEEIRDVKELLGEIVHSLKVSRTTNGT